MKVIVLVFSALLAAVQAKSLYSLRQRGAAEEGRGRKVRKLRNLENVSTFVLARPLLWWDPYLIHCFMV
jgi:hypothetical protein